VLFNPAERLKLPPDVKIIPNGDSILFGIRPEDIQVNQDTKDGHFKGKLLAVEPLGNSAYLDILWNDCLLKAEVSPDFESKIDNAVYFSFNLNRCHFFDMKSGNSIRG
jgi:ABC-type sugar transport system ATPase subunit